MTEYGFQECTSWLEMSERHARACEGRTVGECLRALAEAFNLPASNTPPYDAAAAQAARDEETLRERAAELRRLEVNRLRGNLGEVE